jgi:hypothetical protein
VVQVIVAELGATPLAATALINGTDTRVVKVKFADVAVPALFTEIAA